MGVSEADGPDDGQEADEGQAALEALLTWLEGRFPPFPDIRRAGRRA